MPSYIWSGKDSSGQELSERVTADTPEEARDLLLSRGWTELRRQTSEIHDFVKKEIEAVSDPNYRPDLTPQQEKAYLDGSAPGFWANWWKTLHESAGTFVLLAVWFGLSLYRQRGWSILFSGGVLLAFAFLFPVLHFWFHKPAELFQRLHTARNWRRWDEVLRCLEALKRVKKSHRMGIGEAEMARYRALALAGTGRLPEAVQGFTEAARTAEMTQWLRCSHLATIYTVAGKYEEALDCYRQALEHATEKGIVCLDYGAYLVQRFKRPEEARQLLAQAEATALPELAENHVLGLRGLIAYREGDFQMARESMSAALAGFEKRGKNKHYIFEPSILLAEGCLAAIEAALGNRDEARKHFAKAERYLATIRMDELINEYRSHLGVG